MKNNLKKRSTELSKDESIKGLERETDLLLGNKSH